MAWALCPTHGPIQDAQTTVRGGFVVALFCRCGLRCSSYTPEGFVEHEELIELAKSQRQPREDHQPLDAPALEAINLDDYAKGGGWYEFPDGTLIHGRAKATAYLEPEDIQ